MKIARPCNVIGIISTLMNTFTGAGNGEGAKQMDEQKKSEMFVKNDDAH